MRSLCPYQPSLFFNNYKVTVVIYLGYIEATLTLPLGFQTFEIETLLLVLPSTDYQKRVPVAIGTTITDMVVDCIQNISTKAITIPSRVVVGRLQQARVVPDDKPSKIKDPTGGKGVPGF